MIKIDGLNYLDLLLFVSSVFLLIELLQIYITSLKAIGTPRESVTVRFGGDHFFVPTKE